MMNRALLAFAGVYIPMRSRSVGRAIAAGTALALMGACCEIATAQQFPKNVQGSWRWRRTLEVRDGSWAGSCIGPAATLAAPIKIGERSILWGGQFMSEAHPELKNVSSRRFARKHLAMGVADLKYLGIRSSTFETISVGDSLFPSERPVDLLLIKDPDTLIFEKCGGFYEVNRVTDQ